MQHLLQGDEDRRRTGPVGLSNSPLCDVALAVDDAVQADPQITASDGSGHQAGGGLRDYGNASARSEATRSDFGLKHEPKKTAATVSGGSCRPALAAFLKRPQAELQIGAETLMPGLAGGGQAPILERSEKVNTAKCRP